MEDGIGGVDVVNEYIGSEKAGRGEGLCHNTRHLLKQDSGNVTSAVNRVVSYEHEIEEEYRKREDYTSSASTDNAHQNRLEEGGPVWGRQDLFGRMG